MERKNEKLFLIDGHALIFRMFYAMYKRPMTNSRGEDTTILFGFVKYILELIEKEHPDYFAVAFDPPGKTFRHKMYPEYKANRSATPQPVIDALEPLCDFCHAMRIPVLMKSGFEADDVIGSMSRRASAEGFDVFMVTPDKDYGQLIGEHVFQYRTGKSGDGDEIFDAAKICMKYGINDPLQVIDMLAICGDSSDNVPGVTGVGEVGASRLISKYGSIDGIYAHLDELSPKMAEKFNAAKDHIGLSRELVTIRTDINLDEIETEDMKLSEIWEPQAAELFERYEFTSLKRYLEGRLPEQDRSDVDECSVQFVTVSPEQVISSARKSGKCSIASDCREGCAGRMAVAVNDGTGISVAEAEVDEWKELLADASTNKCGHGMKACCNVLASMGIALEGTLLDTELMHYIIDPEKNHKLDSLVKMYLGIDLMTQKGEPSMNLFDTDEEQEDLCKTAVCCGMLEEKLAAELKEKEMDNLYFDMEEPLMRVLAKMEANGVRIELSQLHEYAESLRKEVQEHQEKIREMAGEQDLNPSSPKQLGIVLYEKLDIDPKMKKSSRNTYPTDESTLSALADRHPIVNEILEYRAAKKLLSTYIEPLPGYISRKDGRIHTTFNQTLTATGRLSSSRPNLQNIPIRTERGREIRKAFVPESPDGLIVSADYSQIELRIMAHLSCDRHLLEAFNAGQDVHAATAAKIFGIDIKDVTSDQRRIAKTANFGIMYGISAFGLSQRLNCPRSEAKQIIDDYFMNFPAIRAFIEDTLAGARENGYVETLFGRRRYIPDINAKNATVRQFAERNAVNAPIQGTSADIIKLAMINIDRKMMEKGLKSRMVLQIHDELLFDTLAEEADTLKEIVVHEMENVTRLSIPLTVECNAGNNWLEAH